MDNINGDLMEGTQELEKRENAKIRNEVDLDKEEETAEDLMTDMKLDDETDYLREMIPGKEWVYHIEVFPWNADDMAENLTKVIKLASFSHVSLKKKHIIKQTEDQERLDDNVQKRQRRGCLHLYVETCHTAKTILRSITWKSMNEKELTFEVTRRCPKDSHTETAYFVADTYLLSKIRFRDKIKGELKDRSAKISNIPGMISREFLDVIFSRAHVVYDDSASDLGSNTVKDLQVKLQEMENFNGYLDLDCFSKASCRSLVMAYKIIFICGQKISLVANNEQTMVAPPSTSIHAGGKVKKNFSTKESSSYVPPLMTASFRGQARGRGAAHIQDSVALNLSTPFGHGFQRDVSAPVGRGRGMGRASLASLRPASTSFPRTGHGMPVPMTGRQKMNEKLRRMLNPSSAGGTPLLMSGAVGGVRTSGMGSVGDSFKQEIASLQSQLARSTQALEAQIARLQQESNYFNEEMGGYDDSQWNDNEFDYEGGESDYMFDNFGVLHQEEFGPVQNQMHRYQSGFTQHRMQGSQTMKGMRRGAAHYNMRGSGKGALSAPPRIDLSQPRNRGSDFKRGRRGRNLKSSQNEMAWSESIFW